MLPGFLNPKTALVALRDIDRQAPSFSASPQDGARKTQWILFSVCIARL